MGRALLLLLLAALASTDLGLVLLSSKPLGPGRWRQRLEHILRGPGGWQRQLLLQFRSATPAQSLAGPSDHWVVGLGPAPADPEEKPTSRSSCARDQALSGTVVEVWRSPLHRAAAAGVGHAGGDHLG